MKSVTDLAQSKKLIELGIDVDTADMWYLPKGDSYELVTTPSPTRGILPAWSLAALLGLIKDKCGYFEFVYLKRTSDGRANPLEDVYRLSTDEYDVYEKKEVDACYELIIHLHEQNLL